MKIEPFTTFAVYPIWNDHDGKSGTALIYTSVHTTRSFCMHINKVFKLEKLCTYIVAN